jgi:hypothetical protein
MQKVTKNKFYAVIGPLDVCLSVLGNYPYTTVFNTRHGLEKGRVVDHGSFEESEYFLNAPAEHFGNGEHILQQAKDCHTAEQLELCL